MTQDSSFGRIRHHRIRYRWLDGSNAWLIVHGLDVEQDERELCVPRGHLRDAFESWLRSCDGMPEDLQSVCLQLDENLPWGFSAPTYADIEQSLLPRLWRAVEEGQLVVLRYPSGTEAELAELDALDALLPVAEKVLSGEADASMQPDAAV